VKSPNLTKTAMTAVLFLFAVQPLPAASSAPASILNVHTGEDVLGARAFLKNQIFGAEPILSNSSRSLSRIDCLESTNMFCGRFAHVSRIDELTVTMEFGLTSLVTVITPRRPLNIVTIYHRGHEGPSMYTPGFVPSINGLLAAGHTVAIIAMPLFPPNETDVVVDDVVLTTHDDFARLPKSAPSSELKFFLQPVFQTVDEFSTVHPRWHIQMAGLSGGGWTVVVSSAIDSRIERSVSIAGSTPLSTWTDAEDPDDEQILPEIFPQLDYADLYVLMTYPDRTATLVYNTNDPCCFAPGVEPWPWAKEVTSAVNRIGGTLEIEYQESNAHDIGTKGRAAMLRRFG
jgi:hypothetical protein